MDRTLLTQCICLTKSARNRVDMYARIRQREKAGYMYILKRHWYLYMSRNSRFSPGVLRENQSTPTCRCSMPAIRQTHAKQIDFIEIAV